MKKTILAQCVTVFILILAFESQAQKQTTVSKAEAKKEFRGNVKPVESTQAKPKAQSEKTMAARPSIAPVQMNAHSETIPVERKVTKPETEKPFQDHTGYEQPENNNVYVKATDPAGVSVNDIWRQHVLINIRKAKRHNRHCGCAGDITFLNNTADTLDIYFGFLSTEETPTIENAVLPRLSNTKMYAPFYILPGKSAIIKGSCSGGLQYEAITRNKLSIKDSYKTPRIEILGSIRLSCIPRTVVLKSS